MEGLHGLVDLPSKLPSHSRVIALSSGSGWNKSFVQIVFQVSTAQANCVSSLS